MRRPKPWNQNEKFPQAVKGGTIGYRGCRCLIRLVSPTGMVILDGKQTRRYVFNADLTP